METGIWAFVMGLVNCWNHFVLKENRTIGGALLNPLPAYISGAFANFGIPIFIIYLFFVKKPVIPFTVIIGVAVGYFIGGMLYRALYPFTKLIGVLSIIPSIICVLAVI